MDFYWSASYYIYFLSTVILCIRKFEYSFLKGFVIHLNIYILFRKAAVVAIQLEFLKLVFFFVTVIIIFYNVLKYFKIIFF